MGVGDGGFIMLLGEFMISVEYKLLVKVIVFNNCEWGLVYLEMEEVGMFVFEGLEFFNVDFVVFVCVCGG